MGGQIEKRTVVARRVTFRNWQKENYYSYVFRPALNKIQLNA